jgi:hypothetical protein
MSSIRALGVAAILLAVLGASAANPPVARNIVVADSSALAASARAAALAASRAAEPSEETSRALHAAPTAAPTPAPGAPGAATFDQRLCVASATCYRCPPLGVAAQPAICYPCPLLNTGVQLRICYPCPPGGLEPQRVCLPCPPFTLQPARICIPCPPVGLWPLRKCPIPNPPPLPSRPSPRADSAGPALLRAASVVRG